MSQGLLNRFFFRSQYFHRHATCFMVPFFLEFYSDLGENITVRVHDLMMIPRGRQIFISIDSSN